jgi:glucose-6-phosphate 1-dehydrogenase
MKTHSPTIVLFGATGNLAAQKLFPALSSLMLEGFLDAGARIIAVSRRPWTDEDFRAYLREASAVSDEFATAVTHVFVDFEHDRGYEELAKALSPSDPANTLFYLALAPSFFANVTRALIGEGLLARGGAKLLLEKPFGTDGRSARALSDLLLRGLQAEQVYPVDHYLGKTTLQALMRIHEADASLRERISKKTIERVVAGIHEEKGIAGRGASYDGVGALRDVGQNHLLEMLAVLLAEYPRDTDSPTSWQDARALVLEQLRPPADGAVRRGRYEGYRSEAGVAPDSTTETAFEAQAAFGAGELAGVPVVLSAGKMLPQSCAFVTLEFKRDADEAREMRFEIQPEARIIECARDGTERIVALPTERDAYANVLLDALRGERRRFPGMREILAAWRFTDALAARMENAPLETYSKDAPFSPFPRSDASN